MFLDDSCSQSKPQTMKATQNTNNKFAEFSKRQNHSQTWELNKAENWTLHY
jgi:hypothetical protein